MSGVVQSLDAAALAPPALLATTAAAVLVADVVVVRRRRTVALLLAAAGALGALLAVGALATGPDRRTACLPGGGCSYAADGFAAVVQALVLASLLVLLPLLHTTLRERRTPPGETVFLLLCSATGALLMAGARDLPTLVISLEVVSLPAFVLVGLRRGDPRSAEGALKAFLVSVVSTAVTLYGAALLYGVTGSLQLDGVAAGLVAHPRDPLAAAAVVLLVAGFAFKVAAVPFQGWLPDAYVGAPLPVAAYLAVVSKTAGFTGLILVLLRGAPSYAGAWGPVVALLAALTMTAGNLLALRQREVVRLLAWSSVAQAGYLLVPLAVRPPAGPQRLQEATTATVGYLGFYAVMTLAAFAAAGVLALRHGAVTLEAGRGLVRVAPWSCAALVLALAALAGLPPGVGGLVGKVVVVRAAVDAGYGWLGALAALNTAVGVVYYLRWAVLVLSPPRPERPTQPSRGGHGAAVSAVAAGALTAVVAVAPQLVMELAAAARVG